MPLSADFEPSYTPDEVLDALEKAKYPITDIKEKFSWWETLTLDEAKWILICLRILVLEMPEAKESQILGFQLQINERDKVERVKVLIKAPEADIQLTLLEPDTKFSKTDDPNHQREAS